MTRRILLVEDSEDNTYLISRILSLQGHMVTCAGNKQPIIACTAMIGEYEKEFLKDSGFTDVFVKPFRFHELLAKIDSLTS